MIGVAGTGETSASPWRRKTPGRWLGFGSQAPPQALGLDVLYGGVEPTHLESRRALRR